MVRKLAYLLVILAVLTAVGELCGLLLPTLSWPFTVSREMSMLNIVCTDQNNGGLLTPQGKFLWFGWVCVLVMGGLGFWLMLKGPRRFHPTPITRRRIQRFKSISRGYVSLIILLVLTLLACMDQCLVGKRALLVVQDGSWYFPAMMRKVYKGSTFGQTGDFADAEANYRELKKQAGQPGKPSLVIMPLVPYDPTGDSTNPGSEALMVNEDGLVCEPGGKPYSGLASRLHKDEEALPHISYKFRKGKKVDRATGWLEDRTEVYSATYENNQIVAEHYSGPGTKEEFLKQTDEHKISRIFYHPSPPLKGGHLLGTNTQGDLHPRAAPPLPHHGDAEQRRDGKCEPQRRSAEDGDEVLLEEERREHDEKARAEVHELVGDGRSRIARDGGDESRSARRTRREREHVVNLFVDRGNHISVCRWRREMRQENEPAHERSDDEGRRDNPTCTVGHRCTGKCRGARWIPDIHECGVPRLTIGVPLVKTPINLDIPILVQLTRAVAARAAAIESVHMRLAIVRPSPIRARGGADARPVQSPATKPCRAAKSLLPF